jgi:hypothetical protein
MLPLLDHAEEISGKFIFGIDLARERYDLDIGILGLNLLKGSHSPVVFGAIADNRQSHIHIHASSRSCHYVLKYLDWDLPGC